MHSTSAGGGRRLTPRYRVAVRDPELFYVAVDRYAVLSARWRRDAAARLMAQGVGTGTAPPPRRHARLIDLGLLAVWVVVILFAFTWPWLVGAWAMYAATEYALLRWR